MVTTTTTQFIRRDFDLEMVRTALLLRVIKIRAGFVLYDTAG